MANVKKKQTRKERLEKKRQAEKLRYQRIKNDPVKNAELKEKERQQYKKKKEKGQIKTIHDMTDREQKAIRKNWREKTKKHRDCLKLQLTRNNPVTPPASDNEDQSSLPQNNIALAVKRRSGNEDDVDEEGDEDPPESSTELWPRIANTEMGKSRAEYMRNYREKKREKKLKTGDLQPKKVARSSTQRSRDFRARAARTILSQTSTADPTNALPNLASHATLRLSPLPLSSAPSTSTASDSNTGPAEIHPRFTDVKQEREVRGDVEQADHVVNTLTDCHYHDHKKFNTARDVFKTKLLKNNIGAVCSVCNRRWHENNMNRLPLRAKELYSAEFPDVNFETATVCASCHIALSEIKIPALSKSLNIHLHKGFKYPSKPSHLPELDLISERHISPRLPFMTMRRLRHGNDNVEKSTQDVPDQQSLLKRTDYKCNDCDKDIFGYRYACVQCVDHDLCVTCEARGAHGQHYVLRVPADKLRHEAMAILEKIRQIVNTEEQGNQDVPLDELECIKCEVETSSDPLDAENEVKIEIEDGPLEHAPLTDEEATIQENAQSSEPKQRKERLKRKAPSDTHTDTPQDTPNTQIRISLDRVTEIIAKRNQTQSSCDPVPSSRTTTYATPTYQMPIDTKPNVNALVTLHQVPGSVVPATMYDIPKCEDRGGLQPDQVHTSATSSSQALVSFGPLQPAQVLVIKTELPD